VSIVGVLWDADHGITGELATWRLVSADMYDWFAQIDVPDVDLPQTRRCWPC